MISRDQRILQLLSAGGIQNGPDALIVSRQLQIPLSAILAMLENESGGANIFGNDQGQPNALPRAWYGSHVTRAKYLLFRRRREKGMVSNGVGPAQLTSPGLQEQADSRGGCWKPLHNIYVGASYLSQHAGAGADWRNAFMDYNGSGPAAEAYAARAVAQMAAWHSVFEQHGLT